MIAFETLVYLDVYKTGSSHVIALLRKVMDEPQVAFTRHRDLHFRPRGKLVVATVRNPFDWYVSLWSSGTQGRSLILDYIRKGLGEAEAASLYDRADHRAAFRRWMNLIHDPARAVKFIEQRYPQSGLAPFMGLYTYRFLRVVTYNRNIFLRRWRIADEAAIAPFLDRRKAYDRILTTENLEAGLIGLIEENPGHCRFKPGARALIEAAARSRRNASERVEADYRDYYDEETRNLVARRDRLFLDRFGYRF
jgi:hypothetical protein